MTEHTGTRSGSDRPVLTPGPDHPLTVEPANTRIQVRVDGRQIVDTTHALVLNEAGYAAAYYIPISDIDASVLNTSDHHTYCPYKGEASYFNLGSGDNGAPVHSNAVWTYTQPYPAVADIAGHAAFYPDAVEITVG